MSREQEWTEEDERRERRRQRKEYERQPTVKLPGIIYVACWIFIIQFGFLFLWVIWFMSRGR